MCCQIRSEIELRFADPVCEIFFCKTVLRPWLTLLDIPTAPIVADNALFFGWSPSIFHPRNHEFTLSHHFSVYPDQSIQYGGYLSKLHCGHLIRPAQVFCPRRLFCSFPLRLFLSRLLSAFRCQTAVFLLLSGDIVQPVLSISVSSLCIKLSDKLNDRSTNEFSFYHTLIKGGQEMLQRVIANPLDFLHHFFRRVLLPYRAVPVSASLCSSILFFHNGHMNSDCSFWHNSAPVKHHRVRIPVRKRAVSLVIPRLKVL